MTGPIVTWASGYSSLTAYASRCAVEWRITSTPSASFFGDDCQLCVFVDDEGRIDQLAIDLASQSRLGEAGADAGGDFSDADRFVERPLGAVGELYLNHEFSVVENKKQPEAASNNH